MGKTVKHNNLLSFKKAQKGDCKKLSFVCRGCTMRGREQIWQGFISSISSKWDQENDNSYMTLEEEPENRYDPNAIMVVCRGGFPDVPNISADVRTNQTFRSRIGSFQDAG